jgi:multicomponent Na+:H+ antiporter subunit G
MTAFAVLLVAAGVGFLAVSALGLIRFPDFYTRAHVVAKSETLGILLVGGGLLALRGFGTGSLRLVMLLVIIGVANPTAVHALARAARRAGVTPWTEAGTEGRPR